MPAKGQLQSDGRQQDEAAEQQGFHQEVTRHPAQGGGAVGKPGVSVTRNELMDAIWPGVVVGEEVIHGAVNKLRKALGDSRGETRYIETLSKRSYRLIAEVNDYQLREFDEAGKVARQLSTPFPALIHPWCNGCRSKIPAMRKAFARRWSPWDWRNRPAA